MSALDSYLRDQLHARESKGLLRSLRLQTAPIDFFSNDYLGLSRSRELSTMIADRYQKGNYPNGSTGSRLLGGNFALVEETEKSLASRFKSEATLLFNSGYTANVAVLSSIPGRGDTILYDHLAHASLKDGARLSLAKHYSFQHNDTEDLAKKLRGASGRKFVVLESIYSMDGDACPLREMISTAMQHDAVIILDEAHSTGVMGKRGSGLAIESGLEENIAIRIYTFGKAMGTHGACVAGSSTLVQYLVNFARPFIYTTAPAPHQVLSIQCAFEYLDQNPELQSTLQQKIKRYLAGITNVNRTDSHSAIQSVLCPGNENVKRLADQLMDYGFEVRPILSPTVPSGTERLRICLHTYNRDEDIDRLTSLLSTFGSGG
jgi:8-amino-7-oxononanoate synthase